MSEQVPLLLSLLLIAGAVVYLLWIVPQRQIRRVAADLAANDRLDLEIKARGVLAQIVGGMLLLVGVYSTWKSFELSRRAQISERLTTAAEKLGSDKPTVRVAAIAALERLATDWPSERWLVMDVLAAFIRETSPWHPEPALANCEPRKQLFASEVGEPRAAADIQAALNVLKSEDWSLAPRPLNLESCDLRGADLRDGNLSRTIFNKSYLGGAELSGLDLSDAHLLYTCIAEYTQCEGAKTSGAIATGAVLTGLSGCTLDR